MDALTEALNDNEVIGSSLKNESILKLVEICLESNIFLFDN